LSWREGRVIAVIVAVLEGRGRVIAVIVVVRGKSRMIADLADIIPTLTKHCDL
jgi:hypothetical protein